MTRDEARAAAEILLAYADGKTVQRCAHGEESWWDCDEFDFQDVTTCYEYKYRIKPEPREWWINPDNEWLLQTYEQLVTEDRKEDEGWVLVREVLDD